MLRAILALVALRRTPITWALYGVNGAWASFIYLSGPVAPVLTEDLGMSVSWAGLVATALAGGITTAAGVGPVAIRRLGRDGAARLALMVVAAAMAGLIVLPPLFGGAVGFGIALALVWIAATGGGTALNASTARLADNHPGDSAKVITEANAAAGWVGLFSPLLLGAALGAGLGWWAGIAVCLVAMLAALAGLVAAGRAVPAEVPAGAPAHTLVAADEGYEPTEELLRKSAAPSAPAHGLPPIFWIAMVALFAAVATEFAVNYWGSTLIQDRTGVQTATATSAMTAIVAGVAIGRTIGSSLTTRLGPHLMLLGGFALGLAGFALLWLATALPVAIAGLFAMGLGIATLFPLLLDRGIALSGGLPDLAMSRSSLILGVAVGSAPFALGALGTVMSVQSAMLLVPVIVAAGLVGVALSRPARA